MKKVSKIIWHDAGTVNDDGKSWFTVEEAIAQAKKLYADKTTSTGEIIHKNKDFIVIAATHSPMSDLYSDITMIPKRMIFKTKK